MTRPMLFTLAAVIGASTMLHAQQAAQSPPASQATTRSQGATGSPVRPGDRNCLRETGSLIPPKPGHCLPVNGRSYSHEDLQRTGATRTADALRRLDPAIH